MAHLPRDRVLGYSSATFYADEGTSEEPMGRESLHPLWQKYKVDIAMYGQSATSH
jgi:acid phosphatase type 7